MLEIEEQLDVANKKVPHLAGLEPSLDNCLQTRIGQNWLLTTINNYFRKSVLALDSKTSEYEVVLFGTEEGLRHST